MTADSSHSFALGSPCIYKMVLTPPPLPLHARFAPSKLSPRALCRVSGSRAALQKRPRDGQTRRLAYKSCLSAPLG